MIVHVEPQEFPAQEMLSHAALTAAMNLDLLPRLRQLDLVLDAPEFESAAFWSVQRVESDSFTASLYGSPRDVLRPGPWNEDPHLTLDPSRLLGLDQSRVDRMRVDRWLYRNLLQLDDLLRGRVDPPTVPPRRAMGLQAVWDVWTDGRLRARQHPGLTQAERRRIFFRIFAQHGLLLPRHWLIFHRLWNDEFVDQAGLLGALDALPRAG